jgi:hypothetical protein
LNFRHYLNNDGELNVSGLDKPHEYGDVK